MRVEEEVTELQAENEKLQAENAELRQQVQGLAEALKAAQQRIEELEKKKKDPPSWARPNKPKGEGEKKPHRKRKVSIMMHVVEWSRRG